MASASPSPGDLLGHFRLIEQIGEGGMGIVYRARDERLHRDVAVKVLNAKTLAGPSASQRFRREALLLGRLNHPNVEAVYDFHSEHGLEYLVIEYVAGTSLDDRLHEGALPERDVISLGLQLARGLAAAHAQGILHRDLKPANLRVTPENVLKILDFGLAQLFAAPDAGTVTETATVTLETPGFAGTLAYMAPEQLDGRQPDTRSDTYSAGAVLYELATGARPFPQRGQMLWDAILHSLPPAPRVKRADISPGLEAVILRCLEKDPNLRYQSAGELLADLERVSAAEETTGSTEHLAEMERTAKAQRRRMSLILAAILLVILVVGYFAKRWWPARTSMPQKIMAVLPFEAVGQDASTSALGLGMMETLTAKLVEASNSDAIQVVAPRDLRARGVKTAEDARREFGTDLVLEGSLQQSGPMYRVTCNLVDSKTQHQLAARTVTADAGDVFGLQDKVVTEALDMLPVRIKPEQRQALLTRRDTLPAAYEAYIRGRGYLQEFRKPEDIDSAIAEFSLAIAIDRDYALSYAALGNAYRLGFQEFSRGNDWVAKASTNCEKALSLNPDLVEGHICLGNLFNTTGKYDKAVAEFERAVQSEPSSEDALRGLADAYSDLGNFAAAEATYKKAIALRPNYWGVYSWLGVFYYGRNRYSDAAEMFRKAAELAPDSYVEYSNLAGAYVLQGKYGDAIEALNHSIALRYSPEASANLGYLYFLMRRYGDAVAVLEAVKPADREWQNWGNLADALYWTPGRRAEASHAYQAAISLALPKLEVNPRNGQTLAYLANYYAMVEDKNSALRYLQRALSAAPSDPEVLFRAGLVYNHFNEREQAFAYLKRAADAGYSRAVIRDTPDFATLRDDARFRKLLVGN